MSRYRRIDAAIWGDARFRSLSDDAQRLWFYLLTGHEVTNLPGVLVLGRAALAEALRWDVDRTLDAFAELEAAIDPEDGLPLAKADWGARVIYLPNGPRHNPPANPNVVAGWRDPWRAVPECNLKREAWEQLRATCEQRDQIVEKKGFLAAFLSTIEEPKEIQKDKPFENRSADSSKRLPEPSLEPSLARARAVSVSDPDTDPASVSEGVQGEGPPVDPGGPIVHHGTAAATELFDGYLAAVAEADRQRTGLKPPERDALIEAANVHLRADGTVRGMLAELHEAVHEWVEAYAEKRHFTKGWSAHKFVDWLNSERDTSQLPEPPPRSPPSGIIPSAKPMGVDGSFDDASAQQLVEIRRLTEGLVGSG